MADADEDTNIIHEFRRNFDDGKVLLWNYRWVLVNIAEFSQKVDAGRAYVSLITNLYF